MLSSESVALQQLGYLKSNIQDIKPGQSVIIQEGAESVFASVLSPSQLEEIDVLMPIPETINIISPCVAANMNTSYRQGFVKNRYVFRTFIMGAQTVSQKAVRRKMNAIEQQFVGKNVLLVDDSIVRGTMSREIVLVAEEAGAIRHPHVYGIDLLSPSELIAHKGTVNERDGRFQKLDNIIDTYQQAAPSDHAAIETQRFKVGVCNGQQAKREQTLVAQSLMAQLTLKR